MSTPREAIERFQILSAFGVSAALHALMILLAAVWVAARVATPSLEPERKILVTFSPDVEPEKPVGEGKGLVPFETSKPAAPRIPDPEPEPGGSPEPSPPITPPPREPADRGERDLDASVSPGERDSQLPAPTGARTDSGTRAGGARGDSFDMAQALSRFQRTARQASAAPLPPGQGPHLRQFRAPAPMAPSIPGMVTGQLEFESGDYDWREYGRMVHAAILRAWYRRLDQMVGDFEQWGHRRRWEPIMVSPCLAETKRLDDHNSIRFVLERRGQVTGIQIEAPSGCPPLDESAQAGLADVVLPPLPSDFPRDREVVHARFIAMVDIVSRQDTPLVDERGVFLGCDSSRKTVEDTMHRYLTALRQMGYF